MDTELLRTFLEVRNTRHFGRAAHNLFITQSAVSARIRQLEADLGVTLFLRERNNIQLSVEGERLVPHAETVLRALARAREEVALEHAGSRHVHMVLRTGIWSEALQERLHMLHRERPELYLRVDSEPFDAIRRMLLDRTADIALLYEAPDLPELESVAVGELTLCLYSSRRRDSWQRAVAEDYIYLNWGQEFSRFHARRFGEQATARLSTNVGQLASSFLITHGGACYLPQSQRRELAALGLHVVRNAPEFVRPLHVAFHASAVHRDLLESIAASLSGVKV